MSLAVKYRPKTFIEIVEQSITTEILQRQVLLRKFKNAYGFFGNSGCGKTTAARAFAKAINGPEYEPMEVDAGSLVSGDNTGAENIRRLMDAAKQRDLVGEYKVIILDEAHNIGNKANPAWAAMLKTLEECPKYTIFILCSTNPEKIPEAILNRLQRYSFTPISQQGIKNRLEYICQQEGFTNYEKTCDFISKICQGSAREAITSLEQVADYSTDLSIENAKKVLGGLSYETLFKLTWALQQKNETEIISTIENMFNAGQNLKTFINMYLDFVIDLSKYILFKSIDLTNIPSYLATEDNAVVQFTVKEENSLEYFNKLADALFDLKAAIRLDSNCKSTIEVLLLRFCRGH